MKKLLLLGGSYQQIPAIEVAKTLGYYTVLCDYLPDNPGQFAANQFYLASTTDKEKILDIAIREKIDGIIAYASDPAAPTASYVAEQLGLPTNPYKSVEILCNKDLFRQFLAENGFHTPQAKGYDSCEEALADLSDYKFPVLVKPVDSSGSKGVSLVEVEHEPVLRAKFEEAMKMSKVKRVIIEEYVEKYGYQIAGDGLVVDGELVFRCFANDHFDSDGINPFVPVSASFPYNMPADVCKNVHDEIQRLLSLLNMKMGTYNFDIRITKDLEVYLMEIAPRSGGNYIPQIIQYVTDVDLVKCAVQSAMGEPIDASTYKKELKGYGAYFAVHSKKSGILKEIKIDQQILEHNIIQNKINFRPGDHVPAFTGANTALGILMMKFDTMEEMLHKIENAHQWIEVVV